MNTAISVTDTRHGLEAVDRHRILKSMTSYFKDEPEFSRNILKKLLQSTFVARLVEYFQNVSSQSCAGPSEAKLHMKTGVFIGAVGWRQIGTEKNIIEVLKDTTLQLTLGSEKQSFELKDLL